jgi:hypothetical protein
MKRAMVRWALMAALLVASGCAHTARKQPVGLERFRVTALQGEPRLAVFVSRNDLCSLDATTKAESCVPQQVTARQSEWFVRCLVGGFRESSYHPDIRSLDADGTLRSVLAELPTQKLLAGDFGASLAGSDLFTRLQQERVSHVIAFAFKLTRNVRSEAGVDFTSGVLASKMDYFRVEFSGSIIEVPSAALAGRMLTSAEGGSGVSGGVVVLGNLPIPIPVIFPTFSNSDAKGDSCEALGDVIARFLYSKAQPERPAS